MKLKKQSTLYASAIYAATPTSKIINMEDTDHFNIVVSITVFTAVTTTLLIEGYDPTSGLYYTILQSAALGATGVTCYKVGENIVSAANVASNSVVPSQIRVTMTHSAGGNITYSVGLLEHTSNF